MNSSPELRARLSLISSMLIFGTIGVFVRYIPLPSSMIAAVRALVGTVFLLLVIRLKGQRLSLASIKKNIGILAVSSICMAFNWILLFEAYRYTTVATATLCYYLAPVFVVLASPFLLKERLTMSKALCSLAALVGMLLVSGVLEGNVSGSDNLRGVLFGLGAAVLYATVILLNKRLKDISSYDQTSMQLGISALVLIPYVLLTESPAAVLSLDGRGLLLLLAVGIVHTGLAYALYFGSMRHLRAQTIALYSYVDPVAAILISALFLRESMGLMDVLGALLVLGSTFLSEQLDRKNKK